MNNTVVVFSEKDLRKVEGSEECHTLQHCKQQVSGDSGSRFFGPEALLKVFRLRRAERKSLHNVERYLMILMPILHGT